MEREFKDIIAKNLPAQVGEVLQKRLQELEEKEKQLAITIAHNKKLEKSHSIKDEQIENLQKIVREEQTLKEKEKQLDKREQDLEITLLKVKLEESEKRTELAKDYLFAVFKNPTFKVVSQEYSNLSVPNRDQYGNVLYDSQSGNATKETKIVQED